MLTKYNTIQITSFVAIIAISCILTQLYFKTKNKKSSQNNIEKIQKTTHDARYILIGNSLLGEGVDEKLLSQVTKQKTVKVWSGGSASAWWYLAIKNIALKTTPSPRIVIICFRDTFLTRPDYRVQGKYKQRLNSISLAYEPQLQKRAYHHKWTFIYSTLDTLLPIYKHRDIIRKKIEAEIKRFIAKHTGKIKPIEITRTLSSVFSTERMQEDLYQQSLAVAEENTEFRTYTNFKKQYPNSFLPLIVNMCNAHDTQLIFVRLKRRHAYSFEIQEYYDNYTHCLRNYLEKYSVPFLDFSNDNRIQPEHFGSGDHMNTKGRKAFTKLLGAKLIIIDKALINNASSRSHSASDNMPYE